MEVAAERSQHGYGRGEDRYAECVAHSYKKVGNEEKRRDNDLLRQAE